MLYSTKNISGCTEYNMDSIIVKSPNDKNLYKAITLDNGLRVMLISDQTELDDNAHWDESASDSNPECEEVESSGEDTAATEDEDRSGTGSSKKNNKLAAAALCVNVGGFSDPEDLPGLAHFLEHMVFMGSEKYPEENAYDAFVSIHGGNDNASTGCERTVYVMDVIPKYFKKALDIFAHCFISPLLKPDSMDREIEAIDSEFSLCVPSDTERQLLLLQSFAKSGHPMSHFMWGNRKTLKDMPHQKGIDVIEAVRNFYNRYYSAQHMTLVVQSAETLETLEEWVCEIFSLLRNNNLPPPSFDDLQEPFEMEKFNKLYKIVPVKNIHKVVLTWVLPPVAKYYRFKPLFYIDWLVGHEGKGSILSFLRKKSWAVELSTGNFEDTGLRSNSTCSLFDINIVLTETGMDNIFQVLTLVFQYLKMLKMEGPKEYIFSELKSMSDKEFCFKEQEDPFYSVEALVENMHLYSCSDYLTGNILYFEYNEKIIRQYIDALKITEASIAILSTRHADESKLYEVEPWTQCNYVSEEIPKEWRDRWNNLEAHPNFHLPERNKFIAADFKLKHKESENKYPYKIFENEQGCLWFKEDVKFKVPKAYTYFHFISPVTTVSALNYAMLNLFLDLLEQIVCEEAYPAVIANIEYSIYGTSEGFVLEVYGFNDKLSVLLETILDKIARFHVEKELFDSMKKYLKTSYYNHFLRPPKLCKDLEKSVVQNIFWTYVEKRNALELVTLEMLMDFVRTYLSQVYVEGLIQGNVTREEALEMNKMVHDKLFIQPLKNSSLPDVRCMQLPYGETYCCVVSYNKEDLNSIIRNYYQFSPKTVKALSLTELLMEFMFEPCFDKLRTNEQLGYSVSCSKEVLWNTLGFVIEVQFQSTKFSCAYVDERVELFLSDFLWEMNTMSEERFQTQLNSLIEIKKHSDLNLKEEVDRNWNKVLTHCYTFDMKEKQLDILKKFQMEDFKNWLSIELPQDVNKRKKLGLQVISPHEIIKENLPVETADNKVNTLPFDEVSTRRDDGTSSLHFVASPVRKSSAAFISNITDFKNNLSVFPKFQSL